MLWQKNMARFLENMIENLRLAKGCHNDSRPSKRFWRYFFWSRPAKRATNRPEAMGDRREWRRNLQNSHF
jgi:hypothetical protein